MNACKPSGAGDNFSFVYCCLYFDTGINEYTLNRPEQFNFQQDISRKFFHNFFSVAVLLIYNG